MGTRAAIAWLLLGLALATACGGGSARRPAPEPKKPVVLASEEVDRKVGEEEAEKVGGAIGILDDPELVAYVGEVGDRLARHAPQRRFSYQFQIVDQDAPNAFALPGGFIYVSRGLLILANSEDELANVLGHEIVHVSSRHAAARQHIMAGMGPLAIFAMGRISAYSRDQEREADRLGQGLAGLAGYDPQAMQSFLKDLEFTERLRLGGSRLPGFFDTHPATTERVAAAGARARAVAWSPAPGVASDRADYLRRLEGLAVGTPASEGVFDRERFLHADLDFTIRFPDGWTTLNTRQAVGAFSPTRDAQVYLEHGGAGDDPEQAAARFVEEGLGEGLRIDVLDARPVMVGPFDAYRVEGSVATGGGSLHTLVTFVVRDGQVYRIVGATSATRMDRYQGTFLAVARSFRPLSPGKRRRIREDRLHIVEAEPGETLRQLSSRTANEWDLQTTAVMNGLFSDATLEAGQTIKVAVSRAYAPAADR